MFFYSFFIAVVTVVPYSLLLIFSAADNDAWLSVGVWKYIININKV